MIGRAKKLLFSPERRKMAEEESSAHHRQLETTRCSQKAANSLQRVNRKKTADKEERVSCMVSMNS